MIDWGTLDAAAVNHALSVGLGRALLYARQHGSIPDTDVLWDALLHSQTYDWTLEGHRAPWLWSIVEEVGLAKSWAGSLLAALPEATSVPDADQLAGLALCIAKSGHEGAEDALEAILSAHLNPTLTVPGARELVQLRGLDGLKTVFDVVGKALIAGDERHLHGMGAWMMNVEDLLGIDVVAEALAHATDAPTRAIRDVLSEEDSDEISLITDSFGPRPLDSGERESLFNLVRRSALAFAAGKTVPLDDDHLAASLARLGRHPPSTLDPLLLALDAHPSPRVRRQLSKLLSGISDPLLRALALNGPLGHPDRLRLLVANYASGDARRILSALDLELSRDEDHDRSNVLLRLHEARPDEDWTGALVHVYTRAPSSLHREEALERLLDDETAPIWMVAEACWDAHPDVAATARQADQA